MDYKVLIEDAQTLQHHGVKGMKWGKRAARAVGGWTKEYGKVYANTYTHPFHSSAASRKLIFKNGKKGFLEGGIGTTNSLGYRNKVVKERIEAKDQYKKDKKSAKSKYALDKNKNKSAYKAAQLINKTRYKKRLREAGGDFESYVNQKKKKSKR